MHTIKSTQHTYNEEYKHTIKSTIQVLIIANNIVSTKEKQTHNKYANITNITNTQLFKHQKHCK